VGFEYPIVANLICQEKLYTQQQNYICKIVVCSFIEKEKFVVVIILNKYNI
jgi:hypothetical protein